MGDVRIRWVGGLACTLALMSTGAAAQPRPNRVTVAVNMAVGSFWSDESHLGVGPMLGVAVRFQPWARWGFEFDTRRYTVERRFARSGVVFAGEGVEVTGAVTYFMRTSGARPFISAGVGILSSERESRFPTTALPSPLDGTPGPPLVVGEQVFHSSDTRAGLSVGGGIDIPLTAHVSLRPEARSLWGAGSVLSPVELGASVGFGW